jgi:acyl carrier protein phosphodiesterase
LLHRAIDTFTDAHPIFRQSTKKLHSRYHHYAGVIVDMYYDHFLAKNWSDYHPESLALYSEKFYQSLLNNHSILTSKTQLLLPYMMEYNWLLSYQSIPRLIRILSQMDLRTENQSQMRFAGEELNVHYTIFKEEFTLFYEELQLFAKQKLALL